MTEVMVFSWWLGCKFYFKKRVRSLAWEVSRVSNAAQESSHNWSITAFSNFLFPTQMHCGKEDKDFGHAVSSRVVFQNWNFAPFQLDVAKLHSTEDECNFHFENRGCCYLWLFRTFMLCTLSVSVRKLQTSSCVKRVVALLHLLRSLAANFTEGFLCRNEKIFWLLT